VPIENAAMDGRSVIQWDKDDLTRWAAQGRLPGARHAERHPPRHRSDQRLSRHALTWPDIPAEDPDVYAMIQRGETTGVFQIESRAQMAMLPRLKPARFYDLVIEVAIVRPGPIQGDMVHPYLRRRRGWSR
jgi:error-prone DNA polymerase